MVGDDDAAQRDVLRCALDRGVTYFDTASGYGNGRSEENLGRALQNLSASPVISTKVVLEEPDLDDVGGFIARSVEASLARFGRNHVEALILHNRVAVRADYPKPPGSGVLLHLDDVFGGGGVAEAFRSLLEQGLVSSVGFTAFGGEPSAIEEMIACGLFSSMKASYNLMNPRRERCRATRVRRADYDRVIEKARSAGLGVMAIRVLASGALLGAVEPGSRLFRLVELAREIGVTIPELAIRFLLSTEGLQTAIMSLSEIDHIVVATEAASEGALESAIMREVEAIALHHGHLEGLRLGLRSSSCAC